MSLSTTCNIAKERIDLTLQLSTLSNQTFFYGYCDTIRSGVHGFAAFKKDPPSCIPCRYRRRVFFCSRSDSGDLSVLPSSVVGNVVRIDGDLDRRTALVARADRVGEELELGRSVGGRAGEEIGALELQVAILDCPSFEVGPWGSETGVCLREGDGAVDGDVDLLAAGHFDVLGRISEGHTRGSSRGEGWKSGAWAHQVAISGFADQDGLCSRGAGANVGGAVAAGISTDAEDQPVGFDR